MRHSRQHIRCGLKSLMRMQRLGREFIKNDEQLNRFEGLITVFMVVFKGYRFAEMLTFKQHWHPEELPILDEIQIFLLRMFDIAQQLVSYFVRPRPPPLVLFCLFCLLRQGTTLALVVGWAGRGQVTPYFRLLCTVLVPAVRRQAERKIDWNGLGDKTVEGLEASMATLRAFCRSGNHTAQFYNNAHKRMLYTGLFGIVEQPTELRQEWTSRIGMESVLSDYFGEADRANFQLLAQEVSPTICEFKFCLFIFGQLSWGGLGGRGQTSGTCS